MATHCIPQLSFKFDKRVVAKFDAEYASADGGAVLRKALDGKLGVTANRGRLSAGSSPTGQGPARRARTGAATHLRARLWLRRWQRRRPAGPRSAAQAAAGSGPARRARLGLAGHGV